MDLATLIGLVTAIGLLGWAMFSGSDGQASIFLDWPSLAIVLGGSAASTLIAFPLKHVMNAGRVVRNAFFARSVSPGELIQNMVGYAEIARRDGILSLETLTKEIDDEFIVKGIQMAVDGSDPELIEQVLTSELDAVVERHNQGKQLFTTLGAYGPAFGMIGTLIGLVVMLKNMDDPSKIGPGMAVAILTTMYGALLANVVALPLADKLQLRSDEEVLLKTIVIRGVMAIQSGDNPRIVEQKLRTFLSPTQRKELADESQAAAA